MDTSLMTAIGFSVIFLATALGSAMVWFFKGEIPQKVNTVFFGFASGIMIAASVWSLLIPSMEGAEDWGKWSFVPTLVGFLAGGLFLVLIDRVVPHFHSATSEEEGPRASLKKSTKMFFGGNYSQHPGRTVRRLGVRRRRGFGRICGVCVRACACLRYGYTEFSRRRGRFAAC